MLEYHAAMCRLGFATAGLLARAAGSGGRFLLAISQQIARATAAAALRRRPLGRVPWSVRRRRPQRLRDADVSEHRWDAWAAGAGGGAVDERVAQ